MPFSSLTDANDVARAMLALDRAWSILRERPGMVLGSEDAERTRLAVIIAGCAPLALNDDDLIARSIERFAATQGPQP
ncbi:MAG TPA: hypothetical protein VGO04_24445 [Ensifer sp.]|jgi:hypothetical protein|uniref:hypothetical protein n=1 Tax=Ensifer sp. TaxID=1872086 RepID=UPI002E1635A0|nr:hypothetical protein [Ensifer sp.]